jgi:putative two-component system response regulator
VADVYDALMETRVYRKGLGHIQASNIIFENEWTQFDPKVVDAFRNVQEQVNDLACAWRDNPINNGGIYD